MTQKKLLKPLLKFSEIKDRIQNALQEKLKSNPIDGETEGFALIEGFMTVTIHEEIPNSPSIGSTMIPIVGIVGKKSGRIYTYALKAILKNLKI